MNSLSFMMPAFENQSFEWGLWNISAANIR